MNRAATVCSRQIWKYRYVLLIAAIAATVTAAIALPDIRVSNSLAAWYPANDPELLRYRKFQETFGSDEIIVVAVSTTAAAGFDSETGLDDIAAMTDLLLDVPGIASVTSLVTVPQSLASARGRLLSADRRTTALVAQLLLGVDIEQQRSRILADIRQGLQPYADDAKLGGYGVIFEALNEASTTGSAVLILVAHLVMVAVLSLSLRRAIPVLATLLAVALATSWTMAIYVATGHALNMVTMVLPTLVLVIGTADCLHIIRGVDLAQGSAADKAVAGLVHMLGPCFLTTITTAAGFLGLTASSLPVIDELGWFGALGVCVAFLAALVVVPLVMSFERPRDTVRTPRLSRVASGLFEHSVRRPGATVAVFAVLIAAGFAGMSQINADTDSIGYLKPDHRARKDSDFIENTIGPYVPLEFVITADSALLSVDNLRAIRQWQDAATRATAVGWSWSLVDALNITAGAAGAWPEAAEIDRRLARMRRFSPVTARAMLSDDGQYRVSFGAPVMSAAAVRKLTRDVLDLAVLPAGLRVASAGYSPLYTRIVDEIVTSQVRGFATALLLIAVVLGVAMRSWTRALLAIPANAVPVVLALGLMGATGIPLDVASATIASVILGLVVDDTVHLLRPTAQGSVLRSMRRAAGLHGGTLIRTTIVLAAGFLVLGLADIRSIAWFGVLTAFAVTVAVVADLTLLPALARLLERRRQRTSAAIS